MVIAARKLQNFAARSYRFAAAILVFHVVVLVHAPPPIQEHNGFAATPRRKRKRQLTCRDGAPKTRRQFEPLSVETRHVRERFNARCVCL
jgi:hypothetical protein